MTTRRAAGILAMLAALAGGCSRGGTPPTPPNVIVYVVDTLRADSLGAYGNKTVATPAIDRLARDGVTFETAIAQSSWTRASIASILTGLHPAVHGAEDRYEPLAKSVPLIAEYFRERGYATAAFTANPNIGSFYGFERGFDEFVELYQRTQAGFVRSEELVTPSTVVTRQAIDWIDRARRPFFLFVLTIDPHAPYAPPDEFDRYGDRSVTVSAEDFSRSRWQPIAPPAMQRVRSLYSGEVSFNDRSFGELLDHLEAKNVARDTIVALTSDHGEEFWEHGRRGHGHALYEESIRVPLILRFPPKLAGGQRIGRPVAASVDLAPTILDLAGLPRPAAMEARSLLGAAPDDPSIHSRLHLGKRRLEAIFRHPWKLILDADGTEPALFDLASDPREETDRGKENVAVVEDLAAALHRRVAAADRRRNTLLGRDRPSAVSETELPESAREALKALGYVN